MAPTTSTYKTKKVQPIKHPSIRRVKTASVNEKIKAKEHPRKAHHINTDIKKPLDARNLATSAAHQGEPPHTATVDAVSPITTQYRAIGRRKEATARVRMTETGRGLIIINSRSFENFFPSAIMREIIIAPLKLVGQMDNHDYSVKVAGGGTHGQAEAVRHALARVLLKWNAEFRAPLKKAGFLRRDPRAKERKKFGFKSARRAPQWAKR